VAIPALPHTRALLVPLVLAAHSVVVLVLGACGTEASAEGGRERPPALVETATGRTGALLVERTYLGTVRSLARAELAAGADGAVVEVAVREGDRVEAGQLLLRIDPDLAQARLRAVRADQLRSAAQGAQAERDAERFATAGRETVAQIEIERARSEAEALAAQSDGATAQVSQARATLDRHRVVAPFDGVVSRRTVDTGDWVSPGTIVLELVAAESVEVLARVEPSLLADVRSGTEATLRADGSEVGATVVGVVPALDPVTRTAQLRLLPSAPAPWLLAGAAVDVHFSLSHDGDGILIPRDALVVGVTDNRVVRVVDGKADPLEVEVLERGVNEVRVRAEGLTVDDQLVVRGNDRLLPGQPVRVVEAPADAPPPGS
jgi:RND family efflux transporter MFP subunit